MPDLDHDDETIKSITKRKDFYSNILKHINELKKLSSSEDNLKKMETTLAKIDAYLKQNTVSDSTKADIESFCSPIKAKLSDWKENFRREFGNKLSSAFLIFSIQPTSIGAG